MDNLSLNSLNWSLFSIFSSTSTFQVLMIHVPVISFAHPPGILLVLNHPLTKKKISMELWVFSATHEFKCKLVLTAATTPGSPPEFLDFSASGTDNKDAFHYGKHLSLFEFCVKWASMNNKISCSHLLSSLTLHCSYRLRFFAFRDHLWDDNSLPQLQSSWLRSTRGSRRSKYTEGVARRTATRRLRPSQAWTINEPHLPL